MCRARPFHVWGLSLSRDVHNLKHTALSVWWWKEIIISSSKSVQVKRRKNYLQTGAHMTARERERWWGNNSSSLHSCEIREARRTGGGVNTPAAVPVSQLRWARNEKTQEGIVWVCVGGGGVGGEEQGGKTQILASVVEIIGKAQETESKSGNVSSMDVFIDCSYSYIWPLRKY